ncbi:16S rRNA (cytosine(1402)-N(4))-methyltransferase RsmH [Hymenobacter busanensis]|uniref:Ribosomal RNA small subunit methyltransferase H n=1 Tax=Hymenobacter busanensis TaxID=2607656 RepID=A0A7L4ZY31_9BACT|nr:16S rRNA (cytosine(1402)-N(4))-methyltransferase RsmH [Hymenobacter busanensis]KAA9339106.1 16S rRNA (cytosine(1402)-N(4))-methyltransferase RsmH [Hymenobacter busanensis]QHJ07132.1 16S rRNA (cytosine(1402)-N(4))-methyltransferase RsmH [Hymenobacter busanensis]
MSTTPDTTYHRPVMLAECLEALQLRPDGRYVDVTFGGGGHSAAILEQLGPQGHLYAFDQDADAEQQAQKLIQGPYGNRFTFIRANFSQLYDELARRNALGIDGLLADLGVSSHQFDTPERGFSTRFDGPLDMRMNSEEGPSAADVVAEYSEAELHRIFGMYGEVTNARTLAKALVQARNAQAIQSIADLKKAIQSCVPRGKENKYLAQVFQALRLEVNDEMGVLQAMLTQTAQVLRPGGRLVVMSYHSLEDRLVKNYIGQGKFFGDAEKDLFGNVQRPFEAVTRKPVTASEEELKENNRSRSAKLRVAERNTLVAKPDGR